MNLYDSIIGKKEKISVIGLGYVGTPLAVAFAEFTDVIGFDINEEKVMQYQQGIDPTQEVGDEKIKSASVEFTCEEEKLKEAKFHVIAVPTPIKPDRTPNLEPLESASRIVARNLLAGSIIVYESTVYPGVTEEICIPILEQESGLKCGIDFKVGYSPERINPQDKEHSLTNILKVVSGMDGESLDIIASVYELIIAAGVYRASSIKVAEAAKVIENSQRDINIAFMNELAMIFSRLDIDTKEVLEAAKTKWNFLDFKPGLVGGHCIGVDPYYLTYKATQAGYDSQIILSGRKINDGMGKYIADSMVKCLIKLNSPMQNMKVAILGFTFKENCQDTRNTKVIDIIRELRDFGIQTVVTDPIADAQEMKREYNITLERMEEIKNVDVVAVCVSHKEYLNLKSESFDGMFRGDSKVIFDIKAIYDKEQLQNDGYVYWRL